MEIVYVHHEGTQEERPLEFDMTSSPSVVYLRKNIEKVTRVNPHTENSYSVWAYEEAVLTNDEYHQYVVDNRLDDQQAQIDYTAMMTDTLL